MDGSYVKIPFNYQYAFFPSPAPNLKINDQYNVTHDYEKPENIRKRKENEMTNKVKQDLNKIKETFESIFMR